ncbi:MAG: hypothetical protein HRT36_00350, partial [Alphaproteobacteria bacterium]|nr:hypothetical protein [Alphaproteobacteria bacterium]
MQLSTPITKPLRPCKVKLSPNKDLLHLLHLALHHCAREQNIAPRLLCSIEELQNLTAFTPEQQEWQDHSLQQGWRREVFGGFAEKIARGSVVLRFQNRRMHFEEV